MTDRPRPWTDDTRLLTPAGASRRSFGDAFERLVGVMTRLRAPDGCPWDREQDLASIKPYLVEETYEVIEALEEGTVDDHKEELGDLLLQVVFQSELRREAKEFDVADVAHGICDKLVRRHPHVFEDATADGKAAAFEHWEQRKAQEKQNRSVIDGVPRSLPALLRAQRVTEKASRVGFDWNDISGPLDKLDEELGELREAMAHEDRDAVGRELGDVLFTLVNLARFLDVSSEDALNGTINEFSRRFKKVEASVRDAGERMEDVGLEELERRWQVAKKS